MILSGNPLRILDFDVEARPLGWYGGDFVHKEITAIAWRFLDANARTTVRVLGPEENGGITGEAMLGEFLEAYRAADMVTGHYIRGFDLPLVNAMLLEARLPLLEPKLSHDTKLDLLKISGLSKSQENLGALLGLEHPKVSMDQAKWREANRLTKKGIALTKKRVVGDVEQHEELRNEALSLGLLGPPKLWIPSSAGTAKYHA